MNEYEYTNNVYIDMMNNLSSSDKDRLTCIVAFRGDHNNDRIEANDKCLKQVIIIPNGFNDFLTRDIEGQRKTGVWASEEKPGDDIVKESKNK
jgi:hypothetical protein